MIDADDLVASCQAAAGDALRTVALADFRSNDYDLLYMRPDIGEQYSVADIVQIYQDVGLGGLAKSMQSALFEPLGELETVVYRFENGVNLVGYNEDGTRAVFVGLGRDDSVVDDVREAVADARLRLDDTRTESVDA